MSVGERSTPALKTKWECLGTAPQDLPRMMVNPSLGGLAKV
jgi:hypothetical protein